MSQNLYEEAIAEARLLRDMAEENAKNKIIDAVTPRIRSLIEQQLLDEADEEELEDLDLDPEMADAESVTVDLDALSSEQILPEPAAIASSTDAAEAPGAGADLHIDPSGGLSIDVGGVSIEVDAGGDEEGEEIMMNDQVAEALARMVASSNSGRKKLSGRLSLLEQRVNSFKKGFKFAKNRGNRSHKLKATKIFESLATEAVILRRQVILTEQDTGGVILEKARIDSIIKEMKIMSRRNNRNIFDFLFEAEGNQQSGRRALDELDIVLADEDLEALGVEDPEEADVSALEVSVMSAGEEEDEEVGEEEGGEDLDLDMDEVYEIDETMLRRELKRMRRLSEETSGVEDPSLSADSFGGGDVEDEEFVDVDEDSLLNALADELGDAPNPDVGGRPAGGDAMSETRRRRRARGRRHGRIKETRTVRTMTRQLSEYKKATHALKGQLTEMNLFNAKLLYANKLMQNRNLSQKQQRAIVEALDNAKTLREAKLLYKSLTASLDKGKTRSLREGKTLRTIGSSSRSTRSAKPAGNGVEVDRWAVLAGIAGNK
jgi:hypothetical protein